VEAIENRLIDFESISQCIEHNEPAPFLPTALARFFFRDIRMRPMRCVLLSVVALLFALPAHGETITVSAAISLKESLSDIRKAYETSTGDHVVFNLDASGKLAAQIQQGAPVDLFISADDEQMDKLEKSGRIDTASRRIIVDNTLVLIISPKEKDPPKSFADLAVDRGRKIAVGEPKTVPAGRYAMQALKALDLDHAVSSRLLYGESVRAVLSYVEQDDVVAGIVYGTDAKQAGDAVKVIATAEASSHDPIEYPAAVITGAAHADAAKRFLAYLSSEPAKKMFLARGFVVPDAKSATTQPVGKSEIRKGDWHE
jgi:molybdate transport system substrate-binding protein